MRQKEWLYRGSRVVYAENAANPSSRLFAILILITFEARDDGV